MSQRFLTSMELADRWRVSPRTIEDWRRRQRAPHPIRIGRRVLYLLDDVEALERAELDRLTREAAATETGPHAGPRGGR